MAILLGFAAFIATLLGGWFAMRKRDALHLILGFSAGAVIGVAFFDLMPEAFELGLTRFPSSTITLIIATGFLLFMFLSRVFLLHPHAIDDHHHHHHPSAVGWLGAGSLSIHSILDGIGIGLAFQVSPAVGAVVAAAVLAHDFSDGINTVSYILNHEGDNREAFGWLVVDAAAPIVGVLSTKFFSIPGPELGLFLALFCGFFLYIGASDLLPESQHDHPKVTTSVMTLLGAAVIYVAIQLAQF